MKARARWVAVATLLVLLTTWWCWSRPQTLPARLRRLLGRPPPSPVSHTCAECGKHFDHVIGLQMHMKYAHKKQHGRLGGCKKCGPRHQPSSELSNT